MFNCLKQLKHGKRVQSWLAQGVFVRWSKSSSNVNEHSSCACHSGCSMANANQLVALGFHLTLVANLSMERCSKPLRCYASRTTTSGNAFPSDTLPFWWKQKLKASDVESLAEMVAGRGQLVALGFHLTLVANLSNGALLKTIAFLCISHNHFRKCLPFRHSVFLVETTKNWKRLMWSPWQKYLLVGVTK